MTNYEEDKESLLGGVDSTDKLEEQPITKGDEVIDDTQSKSKFFRTGYRPTIGWIVTLSLILLFPVQIIVSLVGSIWSVSIDLDIELLNSLTEPIVFITLGIMGIRSFDKLKNIGD